MLNSYRDLVVWQKAMELVKEIYILTEKFPKSEIFGITSQMRRCAVSIPSNLAEGFNKRYRKEFSQFTSIVFGSGGELETQIEASKMLKFAKLKDFESSDKLLEEVMRMLNRMITNLNNQPSR